MSNYVISCCSTADLTKEYFEKRDIHYICFHYQLDGVDYMDDLFETMSEEELYSAMTRGAETKTSQVNSEEYCAYFKQFLDEGLDIIHVALSSGLSGTINSANIAKSMLEDEYPDRKIYVIDSLAASSGLGLLMDGLADMRDAGVSIEDAVAWVEENRLKLNHWFFSTDLSFYVKGGRITKTEGFVGNLLKICPLMNMDAGGHLVPRFKIRTKKKAYTAIVEQMEQLADGGLEYNKKCFISSSICPEDAIAVKELIEEKFTMLDGKVQLFPIGTTIGSHTGPGTVALFFWGAQREEE